MGQKQHKEIKLTIAQKERLRIVRKFEKFFWWSVLPGFVLFPFFDGLFFLFFAWCMFGIAFTFYMVGDFIEQHTGAFSVTDELEFYGRTAQFIAGLGIFLGVVIFVIPGVLGMFDEFGIDLITLIFD